MKRILFFNFDGTCNEPIDGLQEETKIIGKITGDIEDDNISNILKFHLLLGGHPKNGKSDLPDGNTAFYYRGVGTYGDKLERKMNAIFGHENYDVKDIQLDAMKDFIDNYHPDIDKIIITGFSRGGAIARKFAYTINKGVPKNKIIIAIFDTVARVAGDDENGDSSLDTKFNDLTIASNIEKALHIVSLNERRKKFKPTLMNKEDKVTEIWFAGGHSDIGGGYREDGLSDVTLGFLLDWIEDLNLGIKIKKSNDIKYDNLEYKGNEKKNYIEELDLEIDPDPLDTIHQEMIPFMKGDREFCVMIDDEISKDLPIIHETVLERVGKKREYWPKLLLGEKYKVYHEKDRVTEKKSLSKIQVFSEDEVIVLDKKSGTAEAVIRARKKYNHTGIIFQEGQKYRIEVVEEGTWADSSIGAQGDNTQAGKDVRMGIGWDRKGVKQGFFSETVYLASEHRRRVTKEGVKWFTLCGTIGEDDSRAFVIGDSHVYEAEYSGELCAFANDLPGRYGNNSGKLRVIVTLI